MTITPLGTHYCTDLLDAGTNDSRMGVLLFPRAGRGKEIASLTAPGRTRRGSPSTLDNVQNNLYVSPALWK